MLALEVGALTPEETAFHVDAGAGALSFGDAIVNFSDSGLGFVPDELIGDDPEAVKEGLRESFRRLLAHDFAALLIAHGDPMPTRREGRADPVRGRRLTVTPPPQPGRSPDVKLEQPTEPTPVPSPVPGPGDRAGADASADPRADAAGRAGALPARRRSDPPGASRPRAADAAAGPGPGAPFARPGAAHTTAGSRAADRPAPDLAPRHLAAAPP